MCGVAGFWASQPLSQGNANALLERMTTAVKHRGPDGAGAWFDVESHVGLGHRRLAILDLSPTGLQPMTSASGRYVMTFNGEVYNFHEVRQALEAAKLAPVWVGSSDTEVMLAAIEAWGLEEAVTRFVGMFAFALWDKNARTLQLVRDRLGVKPLYFSTTPAGLCFGSELKSLRVYPQFDTSIDGAAVAGYLRANCVPGHRTIFKGSRKVAPGTIATFRAPHGAPHITRWWSPADVARTGLENQFTGSAQEATLELERLLREAVRLRMVSDVPLGAFLSGGVDSSTVVALMQQQSSRPVHTFSIGNESAAFDEAGAARAVARHLNTHHTAMTVTSRDALDVIPKLPTMYDEPFADSSQIPTYLVSALARRDVTVALSGDGGDELFGGYTRHVWSPRLWRAMEHLPKSTRLMLSSAVNALTPSQWNRVFAKGGSLLPKLRLPGARMHKLASVLAASSPANMYDVLASHWLPGDRMLDEEQGVAVDTVTPSWPMPHGQSDTVAEYMMYRDLVGYLPDDILTKVDRASMAVSLEVREPLLDHRLVAFAWSLPQKFKVRGTTGKWVLREVLHKHVPQSAVSGPKMGFAVPLGEWLQGPLRDWAEGLLSEARLRSDGFFNVSLVRERWRQQLSGTRPWEHHLWDVLMFNAWRDEMKSP